MKTLFGVVTASLAGAIASWAVILFWMVGMGAHSNFRTFAEVSLLTLSCAFVAYLVVHLPVLLVLRSVARRALGVGASVAMAVLLSLGPMVVMLIVFMSDHDSPRGVWANLRQAFTLDPGLLFWYLAFAVGGLVFFLTSQRMLKPRATAGVSASV